MPSSKLAYYLGKMPPSLVKNFRSHVVMGEAKRATILAALLDLITADVHDNEQIYAHLYPGKTYSEKQVRNLRSDLLHQLKDFLSHAQFDKSPEKGLFWLRAIQEIGAMKYATNAVSKMEKRLEQQPLSVRRLKLHSDVHEEALMFELAEKGRKSTSYGAVMRNQEEAFVAQTLSYALADQDAQMVIHSETQAPSTMLWLGILEGLEAGAWQESQLIQLYYAAYKIKLDQDPRLLREFISQLTEANS